jgi:NAD(P)H-flavin reductase
LYKILEKTMLVPNVHMVRLEAPAIARKARAGNFVVLMVDETGERIPMTIADWDEEEGSITIIFLQIGTSTSKLAALKTGDSIANLVGPLGIPMHPEKLGTVVLIGGCYGIGSIVPMARALKAAGNRIISIVEARAKNLIYWEDKLRETSDELIVITGDEYGTKSWIKDEIARITASEKIDMVVAIGCTYMMKQCSDTTRPLNIKTIVHLNPIMVDGTGMCGCCRVAVGGETKFACVHGPEFDGHQVDWELLFARQKAYIYEEMRSLQAWECQNWDKL